MLPRFAAWLRRKGQSGAAAGNAVSRVRRLGRAYGDLVLLRETRGLHPLLGELAYSVDDARRGRPNPSRIPIAGDLRTGLASLTSAVHLFDAFLADDTAMPSPSPTAGSPRAAEPPHGDGVLEHAIRTLNLDLPRLIAAASIWAHPNVVAQLRTTGPYPAWYPGVRRARHHEPRRGRIGGALLDDNSAANRAIKLAVFGRGRALGFAACHIWPRTCYDERYHTALPNLVLLPAALAGLSDHDAAVAATLRFRAFELYGCHPDEEAAPARPARYPAASDWRDLPDPELVAPVLARRLRKTLTPS